MPPLAPGREKKAKKKLSYFNAPLSCWNGRVNSSLTKLKIEHVATIAGINVHCRKSKSYQLFLAKTGKNFILSTF
jgi:activator of HSP90 ATPase